MNANQLGGILRAFTPGVVALATYFGFGDNATDTVLTTGIATVVVAGWSAWTNRPGTVIPPKA